MLELVVARRRPRPGVEAQIRLPVTPGLRAVAWRPESATDPRTYVTRVSLVTRSGGRTSVRGPVVRVRALAAWFERSSYASGAVARLHIEGAGGKVRYEVVDALTGAGAGRPHTTSAARSGTVSLRLGRWRSGVYVFRLDAGRMETRAVVVVRSALRPRERVAVVMPTLTWQAYNFLDRDGDGVGDTWYADPTRGTAALDRPHSGNGLPFHFATYDAPFLRWLGSIGHRVEFLTDEDLDGQGDARTLARRFDLLVFPGHHEYVTEREYDVVERYRDLGGNLAFLTSDAFHWRVRLDQATMTRLEAWRRLGRAEAAVVGVQYRANDRGGARRPYVVRNVAAAPWLFTGTGLRVGDSFAPTSGIEISGTSPSSPRRVRVLAEIPALYGAGRKAQMTYYATPSGAKVFAAGAFTNMTLSRVTRTMLANLWSHLARP
jgi:N,N-dimethylformamidase beta subunit-like, C-terminal